MADRPTTSRIPPLPEDGRSDRQREIIDRLVVGPTVNIYTTVARAPELAEKMVALGRALRAGSVPHRDREVLILRTGWNCQSEYEFAQHRRLALSVGMTLDDLARIQAGPGAPGWDEFEAALCRMADELHQGAGVSDATWAALAARYDDEQLIQAVMLVGYYHLVSFLINALGVPLEADAAGFRLG
jgi:alkylhydroperoxidase family enzyme